MPRDVSCRPFGVLPDGRDVDAYTLTSGAGLRVVVLTWGGIVQAIDVPDRHGEPANVTLGCATLDEYLEQTAYLGALIGRYANRIAHGSFTLDGRTFSLAHNWKSHHLHGGAAGFDRRLWTASSPLASTPGEAVLSLAYTSPDGEEGYPGTLDVVVTYTVNGDSLRIDYRATTEAPTVVNLTNHAYYNLAGVVEGVPRRSVADHVVEINASRYTPVDDGLIPTGEIAELDRTPLDFRTPTAVGARWQDEHPQLAVAGGYDHNYVLDRAGPGLLLAARVSEPVSGRVLTVHTTEPGLQFYSGGPGSQVPGLALETQHFPDSPNHPQFPSTVLRPGERFASTTTYRFSCV